MKRMTLLAAVAGVMLAGCSSSDELTAVSGVQQPADATAQYVGFTSTTGKAGLSRAGWEGSIRDAELKTGAAANGFGVTAFFTGTENYNNGDHKLSGGSVVANNGAHYSNFMYNEHVYWDGTNNVWKYDILKPWPNGNATADDEDATGDTTPGTDYGSKVSFFAYAPYVLETTAFGSETDGIVGMSDNAHVGNPTITYQIAADGKNVDLLWGTCPTTKSYQTVTGTTQSGKYYNPDGTTPTGYELDLLTGANGDESLYPMNINLVKQKVDEKVSFLFKHALSKVGGATDDAASGSTGSDAANKAGLLVQLDIDKDGNITGGDKPAYTKVLLRDVQVECTQQMVDANSDGVADGATREALKVKGTLDLATGRWLIDPTVTGSTKHVVTSPGTTDATLTAASTASVNALLAEPAGGVMTGQTAHTVANWDALPAGVLTTPQNVYGTSADKEAYPMVFIPGTIPVLKFTVDYVVRVKDTKLKDNYTEVKQRITKTVEFTKAVELNKKYNILMHLGLTNIKFEATVDNWDTTNDSDTTPTIDRNGDGVVDELDEATVVHLPINVD